jgi:hypothetical protein
MCNVWCATGCPHASLGKNVTPAMTMGWATRPISALRDSSHAVTKNAFFNRPGPNISGPGLPNEGSSLESLATKLVPRPRGSGQGH